MAGPEAGSDAGLGGDVVGLTVAGCSLANIYRPVPFVGISLEARIVNRLCDSQLFLATGPSAARLLPDDGGAIVGELAARPTG